MGHAFMEHEGWDRVRRRGIMVLLFVRQYPNLAHLLLSRPALREFGVRVRLQPAQQALLLLALGRHCSCRPVGAHGVLRILSSWWCAFVLWGRAAVPRARDIARVRSVHLHTACVRPCGPPCAPLRRSPPGVRCARTDLQVQNGTLSGGGERGAKSIGVDRWASRTRRIAVQVAGGEFQREERSPLLTTQSAENSRRKAKM
jgi:hypothetical protein